MKLCVVDVHLFIEQLPAEPSEHIGIEEACETKNDHYYGKEDIRMSYVV